MDTTHHRLLNFLAFLLATTGTFDVKFLHVYLFVQLAFNCFQLFANK